MKPTTETDEELKARRMRESMHPFREGRLVRTAGHWTTGEKLREKPKTVAELAARIVEGMP